MKNSGQRKVESGNPDRGDRVMFLVRKKPREHYRGPNEWNVFRIIKTEFESRHEDWVASARTEELAGRIKAMLESDRV